MNVTTNNQ